MLKNGKFWMLPAFLFLAGCSGTSSQTEEVAAEPIYVVSEAEIATMTAPAEPELPDYMVPVVLPERNPQGVSRSSLRYCPNNRQCVGEKLPPQPCEQPMPQYYKNISELTVADGVLLIDPYTRTKILCTDENGGSAIECADFFRSEGYVLVTDVPQFAGRYDFLRQGTYPTRRWRGGGENVPRW